MKMYGFILWAYAFSAFATGVLAPIYAFYVEKLGGGLLATSTAVAIFSIISGLATIMISRTHLFRNYSDHCLVFGWFMWLLGIVAYLFISSVGTLFIAQIFNGIGCAFSNTAFDAELSETAKDNLVVGWGLFEGINSITSGFAALAGCAVVSYYGFAALINCMVVIAVISFSLIVRYVLRKKSLGL